MAGVDWLGVALLFWGVPKLNPLDGAKLWEFFIGVAIPKLNPVLLLVPFADAKDGVLADFVNPGGLVACPKAGGAGCWPKLNTELVCCVEDCCPNANDGWEVACPNAGGAWVVGFCCPKLKEGCVGGCCPKPGPLVPCPNPAVDWDACPNPVAVWDPAGWANPLVLPNAGVEDCPKEEETWVAVGCPNTLPAVVVDWPNVKVELGWDPAGCCPKEIDEDAAGFWPPAPNAKTDVCGSVFVVGVEPNITEVAGVPALLVPKLNIPAVELVEAPKLNPPVDEEVVEGFWPPNAKTAGTAVVDWAWAGFCVAKFKPPVPLAVVVGCAPKLNPPGAAEVLPPVLKLVDTATGAEGLLPKLKVLLPVLGALELFPVPKLKPPVELAWKLVPAPKLVPPGAAAAVVVLAGWLLKENPPVDGAVEDAVLDWPPKLNPPDAAEVVAVLVVPPKLKPPADVLEAVLLTEVRWPLFVVPPPKLNPPIDGALKVPLLTGAETFEVWLPKLNPPTLEDDAAVGTVVETLELWPPKLNPPFELWADNTDVTEFEDLADWVPKLNPFCPLGEEIDGPVSPPKIDGRADDTFNVELEPLDSIPLMLDETEVVFEEEDSVEDVSVFDGIVCPNWNPT